ncbi:glutathione S-transferase family protein [Caulobacter sp. 17J80-11]|uniref:glutathione S-transferase family protein n=1 Tax=Caulobacter sp. 17J80-11 TaxID=2763502 RepID=UPI0016535B15|nr:glutathione S-transferase family protein [Caulobacter sp. 17J80-11]MBC6983787.1 glutathione S-transferase family protein [Caulobacter sp. 17J80-11]
MSLTLWFHPLSSYCWKVLIGLYETGAPFTGQVVNFADPDSTARFRALWPLAKMPLLEDAGVAVPESTVILEHLDRHHPGPSPLLPRDADAQAQARLWDRIFDLHVHAHMQRIVADRLRPEAERDPRGIADARAQLQAAYDLVEAHMAGRDWPAAGAFTLADCAAFPALFYAGIIEPWGDARPNTSAYLERLLARPSVARVLDEARPWFEWFPYREAMPERFLA